MDETLTDDALVSRAKDDIEAFATLYRRHLHRVYSYLLSRVGNVHDAQDLTTQTFIAALRGMQTYEPRGLFIAWLLGIARYKLSDHFRDNHSIISIDDIAPLPDGINSVEDVIIKQLRIEEITTILEKLNPERAEALRLRYFADLKIREVADMVGKSEGAVKMLIARGLDDIRQVLNIQEEIS
ncbi:MAG: RNA polymerase sigma factor [Anaerolineae bacterium]